MRPFHVLRPCAAQYLHHGTYYGFREQRQMTTRYGLRDLWDIPSLAVSNYLATTPAMTVANATMGLWCVGGVPQRCGSATLRA